jgi:hypothetical protein
MDYHLQNLRTGETVALDPRRTLIGTADHALVRTEGGPHLAALAVRYPGGWSVRGLSDDPSVRYNREPLPVGRQVAPRKGDLLTVGNERFGIVSPHARTVSQVTDDLPPTCMAYITDPTGTEECRLVDHDLLFGRLPVCHVRFDDTRLSRATALLAAHGGGWYVHNLAKKPVGRNRERVDAVARLVDGDELRIGPLVVRLEIGEPAPEAPVTKAGGAWAARPVVPHSHEAGTVDAADTPDPDAPGADLVALRAAAVRLDMWLKAHIPEVGDTPAGGISGWLGAARSRLRGFWLDTPETTAARGLAAAGQPADALSILDRAIRTRPDSPSLLRELFRLYESVGLHDMCYRPLRQIEKLATVRGRPDPWVLETLARVCGRLGPGRHEMFDRAVAYWQKLEALTGVSYARERTALMATRALKEGGFPGG